MAFPSCSSPTFANEYSTLYQNFGKGYFYDNTAFFGLASDSMPWVKWGCALADFDNDGWPDCFFVNGHVDNNRRLIGQPVDYEEIPLLFRNCGGKRFRLSTRDAGPYFDTKHVGRGAAFGDIDNDGDIDIVVNHKDAAPALLRNDTQSKNHWIRFVLQGTKSNRDAIGAKARGRSPAIGRIYRQRKGGYSMQATNDPRVLVGIGPVYRGQESRDPLAIGDREHARKPQGRPGLQGHRAQDDGAAAGRRVKEGQAGRVSRRVARVAPRAD